MTISVVSQMIFQFATVRMVTFLMVSLIAAKATTFVLIQKVAKNQVSRNTSLPHMPLRCKSGKTWAAAFLRRFARSCPSLK
jgi:hypothetical protein